MRTLSLLLLCVGVVLVLAKIWLGLFVVVAGLFLLLIKTDRSLRRPGDPYYVVRFHEADPEGFSRRGQDVAVVDFSHSGREAAIKSFVQGRSRRLELERDPDNKDDPNAIKVIGIWKTHLGRPRRGQLGWVPEELAEWLMAETFDGPFVATLTALFKPRRGKPPGIRMDVWSPRRKRKKAKQ